MTKPVRVSHGPLSFCLPVTGGAGGGTEGGTLSPRSWLSSLLFLVIPDLNTDPKVGGRVMLRETQPRVDDPSCCLDNPGMSGQKKAWN